jgi:hypothetical protein
MDKRTNFDTVSTGTGKVLTNVNFKDESGYVQIRGTPLTINKNPVLQIRDILVRIWIS